MRLVELKMSRARTQFGAKSIQHHLQSQLHRLIGSDVYEAHTTQSRKLYMQTSLVTSLAGVRYVLSKMGTKPSGMAEAFAIHKSFFVSQTCQLTVQTVDNNNNNNSYECLP